MLGWETFKTRILAILGLPILGLKFESFLKWLFDIFWGDPTHICIPLYFRWIFKSYWTLSTLVLHWLVWWLWTLPVFLVKVKVRIILIWLYLCIQPLRFASHFQMVLPHLCKTLMYILFQKVTIYLWIMWFFLWFLTLLPLAFQIKIILILHHIWHIC